MARRRVVAHVLNLGLVLLGCTPTEVVRVTADIQEDPPASTRYRVVTAPAADGSIDGLMLASTAAIVHYGTKRVYNSPVSASMLATNATCGSTFVSPHFAITASHCVENIDAGLWTAANEFFIDHIDVSAVAPAAVHTNAVVTGTWPNWSAGNSIAPPAGYLRNRVRCRTRCGRSATGAPGTCVPGYSNLDIALIECPTRPTALLNYWVYAGNVAAVSGAQVQSYWYHEIIDLPTSGPSVPADNWNRYGGLYDLDFDGFSVDDNFHYTWNHLLWPLTSDNNASLGPATL